MNRNRKGEKANDLVGTWKKLLRYCRKYRIALVIAVICAVVGTVFTLIGPDKLSEITDCITAGIAPVPEAPGGLTDSLNGPVKPGIHLDRVFKIGMFLVTLYVSGYVLSAVQGWIMATVTQKVSKQLRSDISRKINRLPMWFYNRTTTGDVLSRVTNDVDTIGQSLNQSIGQLISQLVLFIGSFIMMVLTNGWMTLQRFCPAFWALLLCLPSWAEVRNILPASKRLSVRSMGILKRCMRGKPLSRHITAKKTRKESLTGLTGSSVTVRLKPSPLQD